MKKVNIGLLDKKRFAAWERKRIRWLKNLSWQKALRLEEGFLSSMFIWQWRKNFFPDNPISLRMSLKHKAR